jgi:poly(hydroxyalkanoate) granule-associated protein
LIFLKAELQNAVMISTRSGHGPDRLKEQEMAKKVKKVVAAAGEQWATMIRDSATQIWLAGLGAFSKAQKEGTQLFNTLVKEGEAAQKRTNKAAGDTVAALRGNATGAWDKLGHVFEQRVADALHSLNMPTKKDLDHLSRRVTELTSVTHKLSTKMGHEKRPRA